MSLRDHITEQREKKSSVCSIEMLHREHPNIHKELVSLIEESRLSTGPTIQGISDALGAEGHDIKPATLSRHRLKRCGCEQ